MSETWARTTSSPLMSSAGDFPVKTSRMLESESVSEGSAPGSGASTRDSLASYDHATSSWRTSQLCLDGALAEYSETWPRAGMTRNGTAYRRRPFAPLTRGTGSGLLPTLAARDYRHPNAKSYAERGGGKKGEQLPNVIGGPLNPAWAEWFMGFPAGWTALPRWATRSSRKSPSSSAGA